MTFVTTQDRSCSTDAVNDIVDFLDVVAHVVNQDLIALFDTPNGLHFNDAVQADPQLTLLWRYHIVVQCSSPLLIFGIFKGFLGVDVLQLTYCVAFVFELGRVDLRCK